MLNRAVLMGRMTRDPELKYTQSNVPVLTFSLAVDRAFVRAGEQRETDFIDVVAWRSTAEFVAKWFKKGQQMAVDGRIQTRKWKDKFDQNRISVEVVADNVYFADTKAAPGGADRQDMGEYDYGTPPPVSQNRPSAPYQSQKLPAASDFSELADDDDVPF